VGNEGGNGAEGRGRETPPPPQWGIKKDKVSFWSAIKKEKKVGLFDPVWCCLPFFALFPISRTRERERGRGAGWSEPQPPSKALLAVRSEIQGRGRGA